MQYTTVEKLLLKLIDTPSVSGDEGVVGEFLATYLQSQGLTVQKQKVAGNRYNVFAYKGTSRVVLQAHMDVVTPHLAAREDDRYIYGRGACDTKGSVAAMCIAAQQALEQGCENFGLLFTVGEELDFCGAQKAVALFEDTQPFFIVGEPTELKPVTEHFGILALELVVQGKAAHSSEPQLGDNAIDTLVELLHVQLPKLSVVTDTLLSVVKISGGVADNIIPAEARALLSFRIAPRDTTNYATELRKLFGSKVTIRETLAVPPVASTVPDSLAFLGAGTTVKYCTELNFFKTGLVLGPGSIVYAHSEKERVAKSELHKAVELYKKILLEY